VLLTDFSLLAGICNEVLLTDFSLLAGICKNALLTVFSDVSLAAEARANFLLFLLRIFMKFTDQRARMCRHMRKAAGVVGEGGVRGVGGGG